MKEDLIRESYLDQEVDVVQPFEGPAIRFSHIEANNDGLRPYQSEMKQDVYNLWDKIDNVMLQMPTGTGLALRASVAKGYDSRVVAANGRLPPRKKEVPTIIEEHRKR